MAQAGASREVIFLYFHFLALVNGQSAALSSDTQLSMSPES